MIICINMLGYTHVMIVTRLLLHALPLVDRLNLKRFIWTFKYADARSK